MKKIILAIAILTLIISCNEDDYEAPFGDFSNFSWITSNGFEETDYVIAVNNFLRFRDVSKNAIEHTWSIPGGTSLLNSEVTENDSIFSPFITSNGALNSKKALINVLFKESGVKEIKLRNVFRDSVANAIPEGSNWLIEETFVVTVLADLAPAFKVMKGDEEILNITENDMPDESDSESWPTVTLEAGEKLTYVDMTTVGNPNSRTWNFNGGNVDMSEEETVDVFYNSLGNTTAGIFASRRGSPESSATKVIPLNIKVTPSTQPFVISSNIVENASEIISFNVSGEIANVAGEESNFVITVMNTDAGFNQNIPVESIMVNSEDATQIDLVLSAPIFNTDDIAITYTSGNIMSVDSRVLESFGPQEVEMNFQGVLNIAELTGYEVPWDGSGNQFKKANTENYFAQHNADNEAGPIFYFRDPSFAFAGDSSMKFETPSTGIPNDARLRANDFAVLSPVLANTYLPSVWVFIEEGNTMSTIQYNFQNGPVLNFDISTTPRGEWTRVDLPAVMIPAITTGRLDLNIRQAGQDDAIVQKLWLDNFDLLIVEPRL